MRNYNFELANTIVNKLNELDVIENASLGMHEDWFWTAEEIWNKEQGFVKELNENTMIGGINGSTWATPVMVVTYTDGEQKTFNCYTGDTSMGVLERITKMKNATSGVISSKVQELRDELEILNFNTDE